MMRMHSGYSERRLMTGMILFESVILVPIAALCAGFFRFSDLLSPTYFSAVLVGMLVYAFLAAMIMQGQAFLRERLLDQARSAASQAIIWFFGMTVLAFLLKQGGDYSRAWFVIWTLCLYVLILFHRVLLLVSFRFLRQRGWYQRHVLIIGNNALTETMLKRLHQVLWSGYHVVAIIHDHPHQEKPNQLSGVPVINLPANIADYASSLHINEIWLILPFEEMASVTQWKKRLCMLPLPLRLIFNSEALSLFECKLTERVGFPALNLHPSPIEGFNYYLKCLEDRLLAPLILFLIAPLLLLIAIGIKLTSRGPVLFKQKRLGYDGRIIKVYKFRTMAHIEQEEVLVQQAKEHDARVTWFGKLLRRTSLDELPQFINVLQGRMSIVGPRPHALSHNAMYSEMIDSYMQRHRVKPGITGWAQVNGWRGETDTLEKMQKRVEYDFYYMTHWSLWLDLKIIMITLWKGFVHKNAY